MAVLEKELFGSEQRFRDAVRAAARRSTDVAVVRCCFGPDELEEWVGLSRATRTVLVDPGEKECKRRVHLRGRKNWRGEVAAVADWYRGWVPVERSPSREW